MGGMERKGKVWLVGAGPGDGELITVKGKRLIESCDALVYDYLVDRKMVEWLKAGAERHYVGKRKGFHSMDQSAIGRLLLELSGKGKEVVRLKGGDPFIFGRGGEELELLEGAGIEVEVVPGVTAAMGCAAAEGIALTQRGRARELIFLSGHSSEEGPGEGVDWEHHGRSKGTLVIYMGVGELDTIISRLRAGGMNPEVSAVAIQWGTTDKKRSVRSNLKNLSKQMKIEGVSSPAIIIVGPVAKPLQDRRERERVDRTLRV